MSVPETSIKLNEPVWEIAHLFPAQGMWSEEEYLSLDTNHLVEFSDGVIEVLSMPTDKHQAIVAYLHFVLLKFLQQVPGSLRFAPLPLQIRPGKYREPDILFLLKENDHLRSDKYWAGADLVMEVISPTNSALDIETKRHEYAIAGIPEYWIIHNIEKTVTVLVLKEDANVESGVYRPGQTATSPTLSGFQISVSELFDYQ